MIVNIFSDISPTYLCLCGSKLPFSECCQKIMLNHSLADSPEKVMRCRYSSFVAGNVSFLLQSWDASSRPQNLDLDTEIHWLGLEI